MSSPEAIVCLMCDTEKYFQIFYLYISANVNMGMQCSENQMTTARKLSQWVCTFCQAKFHQPFPSGHSTGPEGEKLGGPFSGA